MGNCNFPCGNSLEMSEKGWAGSRMQLQLQLNKIIMAFGVRKTNAHLTFMRPQHDEWPEIKRANQCRQQCKSGQRIKPNGHTEQALSLPARYVKAATKSFSLGRMLLRGSQAGSRLQETTEGGRGVCLSGRLARKGRKFQLQPLDSLISISLLPNGCENGACCCRMRNDQNGFGIANCGNESDTQQSKKEAGKSS